jgi:hypothetical protein
VNSPRAKADNNFFETGDPMNDPASGGMKKAEIMDSGLIDHEMVAGSDLN